MSTEHAIPELDRKGLREFALTMAAVIAGLFGLFFPWLLERSIPLWPWVLSGGFVAWGIAAPETLRPVYRGWMRFGLMLSKITTPIIMGLVFFLVVFPMAALKRIFGTDAMARDFDDAAGSYRVPSKKAAADNLEKPF